MRRQPASTGENSTSPGAASFLDRLTGHGIDAAKAILSQTIPAPDGEQAENAAQDNVQERQPRLPLIGQEKCFQAKR
jgi:hypothetical protein